MPILQNKLDKLSKFNLFKETIQPEVNKLKTVEKPDDELCKKYSEQLDKLISEKARWEKYELSIKVLKQVKEDESEYNRLFKKKKSEMLKRCDTIQKKLWKYDESIQDMEALSNKIQETELYNKNKSELGKQLNRYDKDKHDRCIEKRDECIEKLKIYSVECKNYNCPDCGIDLCIRDDSLVKYDKSNSIDKKEYENLKNNVEKYSKRCDAYNTILLKIKQLEHETKIPNNYDIADMRLFRINHGRYSAEYKNLRHDIDNNNILKDLAKSIQKRKEKYKNIRTPTFDVSTSQIVELRTKYEDIKRQKSEYISAQNRLADIQKDIIDRTVEYELDEKGFKLEIKRLSELVNNYREQEIDIRENIEIADKYAIYEDKKDIYQKLKDKLEECEDDEKIARDDVSKIGTFIDCLSQAESICIVNVIKTLESIVQSYLDIFFVDDMMSIQIDTTKDVKNKKTKTCINIQIQYKGMDCLVGALSGGERQRLIVAFNLALGEMMNVPFIMLDECTSNLDQESTQLIIAGIRERIGNKNIVIIAHQIVSGLFDNVIEV